MKVIHALLLLVVTLPLSVSRGDPLMLWYSKPGKTPMTEGLPIGNGRLGALLLGGVEQDRIVLNEDSLWTGNENPSGDYDSMGAYQMLGELVINLSAKENFSAYRRTLDLDDALATVSYQMAGVRYEREFFCSHPSGLFVAKFSADKPGQYSGT
ncbi:MAG TPA: glycoside hydrolase N-terminal domain-containing protein, partial [Terriglobales bacterium]